MILVLQLTLIGLEVMKYRNLKILLSIMSVGLVISIVLLVVIVSDVLTLDKKINSINTNVAQLTSTPTSSTSPSSKTSSTPTLSLPSSHDYSSQLTSIQSSLESLSLKVSELSTNSGSGTSSCSGTLSENLSGSADQIGSFTDYSLSGSSPIDLTCD